MFDGSVYARSGVGSFQATEIDFWIDVTDVMIASSYERAFAISCTSLPSVKINLPQGVAGEVAGWLTGLAMIGFFAGMVCDDGDTSVWIVGGWVGGV